MTDVNGHGRADAARHMLGECIRDACGEDVNLPNWVADEILAEYDRQRGQLEQVRVALNALCDEHDGRVGSGRVDVTDIRRALGDAMPPG